ncbi:MAG: anthranilate phosphoribosyltransferase [Phycisphaeraceae bacterium]|nr:anthranilate phosphoribosyltransferase [Phycisphaeraceae bacterium]
MTTAFVDYLNLLIAGQDLTQIQAGDLLDKVFSGDMPEAQIAAFLTAMRIKGPTPEEIAGLAGSLRSHAVKVTPKSDNLIDTCGTGGGSIKTCNVSTASAIVAAGAGAHVAKHGNRGITSGCGSADVLEALGVKIDASPETIAQCIDQAGVGFMFAPMFHPAMKYVQPIRKTLGFRTVFNILGPLANPANAQAQILGVADETLMETMIRSLKLLGSTTAMVVHSNGLDEISTLGPTRVMTLRNDQVTELMISPKVLGMTLATQEDLSATDAPSNARALLAIFKGQDKGPKYDIITLNASAAIFIAGLADTLEEALTKAKASIDDGKALQALNQLIELSNQ